MILEQVIVNAAGSVLGTAVTALLSRWLRGRKHRGVLPPAGN